MNNEIYYFNNQRTAVIAWSILIIEVFNIINVLYFSKSGLGTLNNQRYFMMYLLLLAGGIVCLALRRIFMGRQKLLLNCYTGFAIFCSVWHAALTALDLRHNSDITVFIAAMFGLAFLLRMKPVEIICTMLGGYTALILYAWDVLTSGIVINASIVTLLAIFVSCSRYFSSLEEIEYRQKMIQLANRNSAERQNLSLMREQQIILLTYSKELLFLWSKEDNSLTFPLGRHISHKERLLLLERLKGWDAKEPQFSLLLQQTEQESSEGYLVHATPQFDYDGTLIGAVGRLTTNTH